MLEGFIDDIKDVIQRNGRIEEMRQIARVNGFRFRSRETFAKQDYLIKEFSIFKGKNDKRIKGIMMKKEPAMDINIRVYDYWYFGDFKKRKTTVFEVFGKALDFPRFEIRPKGLLNQMTEIFWAKEKAYPNQKDFHTKYEVLSMDAKLFEAEMSPKVLEHIMDRNNISIEGEGDYLLIYTTYEVVPAKDLTEEYDYVLDLVEIILKDDSNQYV